MFRGKNMKLFARPALRTENVNGKQRESSCSEENSNAYFISQNRLFLQDIDSIVRRRI